MTTNIHEDVAHFVQSLQIGTTPPDRVSFSVMQQVCIARLTKRVLEFSALLQLSSADLLHEFKLLSIPRSITLLHTPVSKLLAGMRRPTPKHLLLSSESYLVVYQFNLLVRLLCRYESSVLPAKWVQIKGREGLLGSTEELDPPKISKCTTERGT